MNLINLLEKFAGENPSAIALRYPTGEVRYSQLTDAISRLASGLRRNGISHESRVALILPNIPHYVISYYAILKAGGTVVPIPIGLPENEFGSLLEEAEPEAVIFWAGESDKLLNSLPMLPTIRVIIGLGENLAEGVTSLTRMISKSEPEMDPVEIDDDDLAVVRLGSGPTGRPVGAEFTHRAITSNAISVRDSLELTPQDCLAAVIPLSHYASEGLALNPAIATGASIRLFPKFETSEFKATFRTSDVTIFPAFPSMLRALIADEKEEIPASNLRYTIATGGYLSDALLKDFEKYFGGYTLEGYTLLTVGPVVAINKWRTGRRVGSLGHPLPGVEMRVIDASGQECSIGEVGELSIKGNSTMRGFVGRSRLTTQILKNQWISTGDYVKMDINGFFYAEESIGDHLIKDGSQVFVYEIERILKLHPEVDEAVVVVTLDEQDELIFKACVVLTEGFTTTTVQISEFLKRNLSQYKLPEMIRIYKDLPLNEDGEVNREELSGIVPLEE